MTKDLRDRRGKNRKNQFSIELTFKSDKTRIFRSVQFQRVQDNFDAGQEIKGWNSKKK